MTDEAKSRMLLDIKEGETGWTSEPVYLLDLIEIAGNLGVPPWKLRIVPGGAVMTGMRFDEDQTAPEGWEGYG